MCGTGQEDLMVRYGLIGFAAVTMLAASLVTDDSFARGGRGGGGGFRGGGAGMRAGGVGGGGMRMAGARPSHPIAGRPGVGRPGYPGRPIAGRPGYGGWRGVGYGAAAGAAAAGLYGYYNNYNNNGCYYDTYGHWVCPYQSQYYGY
jgi:hypothetical protein